MLPLVEPTAAAQSGSATNPLTNELWQRLADRQTHFTLTLPAASAAAVQSAFDAALSRDDYLREDYHASDWQDTTIGNQSTVAFRVSYWETAAQVRFVQARLRAIVTRIVQPSMTDVEKEKAIHDYIVLHVRYDQSLRTVSPYDALTKGTTVCQGYAMMAYQMLLDAHIPAHIVDGTAGGQSHAWDLVRVAGHWYNLDVTWDDPVPDEPGQVHYDYFNLTDAQLGRDHRWAHKAGLPLARTNFLTWLGKAASGPTPTAARYRTMMKQTGLYLETAAYTYTNATALQAMIDRFRGATLAFRYPYGAVASMLQGLQVSRGYEATVVQDLRSPDYAIVTLRFG